MTKESSAVSRGLVLLAVLAIVALAPMAAGAQVNGNEEGIPTLDVVGLVGLAAAVGGAGILGLRARRRGGRK
jgi:hypothetical protein